MRAIPFVVLTSVACRGFTADTAGDAGDGVSTGDTASVHDGFKPEYFAVTSATFAVDDQGEAVGFQDRNDVTQAVTLVVEIGDEGAASGFTEDNSCAITFSLNGPLAQAGWASLVGAWAAWEIPSDTTTFSTCDGVDFPPAWGDPEDAVSKWRWGFGVQEIHPDTLTSMSGSTDFPDIEDFVAGGGAFVERLSMTGIDNNRFTDGWVNTAVVFAYEVEPDVDIPGGLQEVSVGGNPVLVDAGTLQGGNGVVSALYREQGVSYLRPANLLLDEPE